VPGVVAPVAVPGEVGVAGARGAGPEVGRTGGGRRRARRPAGAAGAGAGAPGGQHRQRQEDRRPPRRRLRCMHAATLRRCSAARSTSYRSRTRPTFWNSLRSR
jgi:hypothetical protein